MRLLLNWILSALVLLLVAHIVPGFEVRSFWSALLAVLVIGFINATLGFLLKLVTLPLSVLTLGIFWFVINAVMLELAAYLVPGFRITHFSAAFIGAILLTIINLVLRAVLRPEAENR